jgi:hypothetical protein
MTWRFDFPRPKLALLAIFAGPLVALWGCGQPEAAPPEPKEVPLTSARELSPGPVLLAELTGLT